MMAAENGSGCYEVLFRVTLVGMVNSNAKGDLIARLVASGVGVPVFDAEASGPPHERTFRAQVSVDGRVLGSGEGRSKREAERVAAEMALGSLNASPVEEVNTAWPVYAQVLAQAVEVALEFAGDEATLEDVQRDAARFYRGLLGELGHGPEAT